MSSKLWRNQQQTVDFALERNSVFDMSDPGTGKTRAHLEVFNRRFKAGNTNCLVVLCPKTLMQNAWGNDLDTYYPRLPYALAYANCREQSMNLDVDVYIINSDGVKWLAEQPKKFLRRFSNATLIVDESTCFKHHTTPRSKAAATVSNYFKYVTLLTATPNPKSVTELWHQAFLLDRGERLGKSFYQFRNAGCTPVQTGPSPRHVEWRDKADAEEAVSQLLADITIRHQFEDCMDIPKNLEQFIRFDPSKKLLKHYTEMETKAVLELEKGDIIGINAAVVAQKLCQIASGAAYHSDGSYTVLDDTRYQIISDIVEQHPHTVTFFNWSHQKEQLKKWFTKRGISHEVLDSTVSDRRRSEICTAYQRGDLQTILLHPKTGAHGLTLTRGVATIWSSPVHEADFVKQGKYRIYRGGQTKRTYTKKVCAAGTCDEYVYENAGAKGSRMNNLLKILRQRKGEK